MSHQRTITVAHPDQHGATAEQIEKELDAAIKDEDFKRVGVPTVEGYENVSGSSTKFTLRFDAEPRAKAAAAPEKK